MRTLAITQNITLDGRIEMLGDWFDPMAEGAEEQRAAMHEQDERSDALLLGRRTFEDFRGFWPQQTDDPTGVADSLEQVQKYVVSSTMTDPQWQRSTVLAGVDDVRTLKEQPGRDIVCTGSVSLTHALLGAGLVDELRLNLYPVVQGAGRPLFPEGLEVPALERTGATPFPNGVVLLVYRLR